MKKFALLVSLLFGMSAVAAYAQTSTPSTPDQSSPQSSPSMSGQQYPGTQSQSQPSSSDSTQALANVQKALQQDSSLSQAGVSAQTGTNNNIVLTGTVQSQADKDHAEQVARSASGGMSVDNQIQVSSSGASPSGTTTNPPPQGNSFLPSDSAQTASGQDQSTAGQETPPTQNPGTSAADQNTPSQTTPSQTTPTPDQGTAGQSSAGSQSSMGEQGASGANAGQNAGTSAIPQIQNALQQQPSLSGVTVNETDSQIELSGTVAKDADKKMAKQIAEQYASGKKVVNHITVGEHK